MEELCLIAPETPKLDNESLELITNCLFCLLVSVLGPILYRYFRSRNIKPEFTCGEKEIFFEIPKNSQRFFCKYGPEIEVASIDIKLVNKADNKDRYELKLTQESSAKHLKIQPGSSYHFTYKTKEEYCFSSSWSKRKTISSEPKVFHLLPGETSREKCDKILEFIMSKFHHFRALLIGKPGSGKSSLINSIASTLAKQWNGIAVAESRSTSCTQCMMEYEFPQVNGTLYDLFGWEESFKNQDFKDIAEGKMHDVTINHLSGKTQEDQDLPKSGNFKHKMDVVIFVMSATNLGDFQKSFEEMSNTLTELRIPYIVVITKVDEIPDKKTELPISEKFFEDARVVNRCKGIRAKAKYSLVNYQENDPVRPEIDEITLTILKTIQERSIADFTSA